MKALEFNRKARALQRIMEIIGEGVYPSNWEELVGILGDARRCHIEDDDGYGILGLPGIPYKARMVGKPIPFEGLEFVCPCCWQKRP